MQRQKKISARILSLALTVTMVCTMLPTIVFAAEEVPPGTSIIPECHLAHDKSCGYIEAVEGAPCTHRNEDDTYRCAPIETDNEISLSDDKKDFACDHTDDCGYAQTIEGASCLHSCELCVIKDNEEVPESDKQEQPECICETRCFAGDLDLDLEAAINLDCSVCGVENADLEHCKVVAPMTDVTLLSEGTISDFDTLSSKISSASTSASNPTIIEIAGNFDLTAAITINGKHVKLTSTSGSAYTLTRGSSFTGIPFSVSNGGSLTLENIVIDGNKNNTSSAGVLVDISSSKLTLEAGAVLQNNKNSAIEMYKANACVTMNGGKITGNAVIGNGGAIRFTNSAAMQFIMNNGEISGNTATGNGSAIYEGGYNTDPIVTISGGEIKNNTANGTYGGAIYSSCMLEISNGTISGNAAPNGKTGGIFKTSGGGVTMTGGTIEANTAKTGESGYNMCMKAGTLTVGGSATIPNGLMLDMSANKFMYVSSALTGSIGIEKIGSMANVGDVAVKGSSYTLTEDDKSKFSYVNGAFAFALDSAGNQLKLAIPAGVPEKDPSEKRIYAKGLALILAAGSANTNDTVIYLDKNSNGTIDAGDVIWAPSGMDLTTVGNNLVGYIIVGGAYQEDLTGNTKITMLGGNVFSIFAGGSSGKVTGNTSVTVSGGTVGGSVYGGGLYGVVAGDTSVIISGGTVTSDVFGGGQGDAQAPATSGNTHVSITGGKVRMAYGSGSYPTDTAASTDISISGGEITGDVYGGGAGASVTGQAKITVTNGKVDGSIYGSTYQAGTVGSSDIVITGGTVVMSVYPRYTSATVTGDKKITVGGAAKIGSLSSPYIFGVCFNGGSTTNGVTSFTIAPDLSSGASVNVNLPSGFKPVDNPVIATEAVSGDVTKLHLVGAGATGLEAYFDSADRTIKVKFATEVSRVTVSPTAWIIRPGVTKQFAATVEGTGSPIQTVTWTVSDNSDSETTISTDGLLNVAPGETAQTLTVKATSTADTGKFGAATVTLQHLTAIRITAQPNKIIYAQGASFDKTGMIVTADFYENNGQALTQQVITDYTISPSGALSPDNTKVTVSYTVGSVTKTADVTITVNGGSADETGSYVPGSSGDSGNSSSGGSTSTLPLFKPTEPVTGSSSTNAVVDNKGNTTVHVTDKSILDALQSAKHEANKKGVNAGEISVVINVTSPVNSNPNTVTVNLPKTVQRLVIRNKIGNVVIVIDKPDISISMNLATITEMNRQANANIQLSATRTNATKLSTEAKNAIGSRPAFNLKAAYANGAKSVSNFGSGTVSVAIPYTLRAGEVAGGLYAGYVDSSGKVTHLINSAYDAENNVLLFSTNHFSVFGVGYKTPDTLTDISNHWAKTDITFVVSRGLMTGTSNTTFSPDSSTTRAMFVTALGRLANVDVNSYKTGNFSDVKADAYYAPYVNWAASKGITGGTTATTFSPDTAVTRQEMAVFMSNYAKAMGYAVPETRDAVTFADNSSIESRAVAAVKQMQMDGVLNGKKFDPTGTATRAEAATVLHRYVEPVINRTTTEGRTTNDSDSGMSYQHSNAATGTKTIGNATAGATTSQPVLSAGSKNYTVYAVKKNDWLSKIALANHCTVDEIVALNSIKNPDLIYEGQEIKIPQK